MPMHLRAISQRLALFLLLCLPLMGCATHGTPSPTPPAPYVPSEEEIAAAQEEAQRAQEEAQRRQVLQETYEAIQQVNTQFHELWQNTRPYDLTILTAAIDHAIRKKHLDNAEAILHAIHAQHPDTSLPDDILSREFALLLLKGDFARARARAREFSPSLTQDPAKTYYWKAFDNDPRFGAAFVTDLRPDGKNALAALGGGSTVSFRYQVNDTTIAAIKPDQDLRQTMYRSGIAFFRLCEILQCSFAIPESTVARFTRNDFHTLYAASRSTKNAAYKSKFVHLIWETENNQPALYAIFKEWIPAFEPFPIEVTAAWTPYLGMQTTRIPPLSQFFNQLLAGGRPSSQRLQPKFLAWTEGHELTTQNILQQISDLILIDFLTNNWDRFSGDPDNYGANAHFQAGGIIAIDNDASFPPWHAPRVVRRLNLVKRFSKQLVQNLRDLDPDVVYPRLFPNPTREEIKSLERFTERRKEALNYIDGLIRQHGAENVLVF